MLEPRRLAARAAAHRMAQSLGERVGETVGYRVRLDSQIGPRTRIEVVTDGVFTRMILDDPTLDGVAGVIFDEFHERSLDADLGLAFARHSQELLRPDLRLLVMSATLDIVAVAALLGDAPVVESSGRMFPVSTRYLGRGERLEDHVAGAIARALAAEDGGLLVFLPGQGEIRRVTERLAERIASSEVDIVPLYGALGIAEQDLAIAPAQPGRRKVVLATDIAQTSLTLEDVRVVIDAGQSREPRYDPASGLTRLVTVRASRAAVDQRRGRAGRTGPGVCWRLWDEAETRGLAAFDQPEIQQTDLARLALDLARWGERDAQNLAFLDPPRSGALAQARELLGQLGVLNAAGDLTAHGLAIAAMPLPPRLAHMILHGAASAQALRAAQIAAILTERGLGGRSVDLTVRLQNLYRDRSARGRAALDMADRWARTAGRSGSGTPLGDGRLLALAFPERVAKARGGPGEFLLVNGRGAAVDPGVSLAREGWLAVAELGGGVARDRVFLAAPLDERSIKIDFAAHLNWQTSLIWSPAGSPRAVETLYLGKIAVDERQVPHPDATVVVAALIEEARERGLEAFAWGSGATALRSRAAFAGLTDLQDTNLLNTLPTWLGTALGTRPVPLTRISDVELTRALETLLSWEAKAQMQTLAPLTWEAPTGSRLAIDYGAEAGPRVDVRVQELFGLKQHPTVGHGQCLTLALLSPAHRPLALTRDLPGFWSGSWTDVRKEMRGRYPKHLWPEDPANALPTRRVKARG